MRGARDAWTLVGRGRASALATDRCREGAAPLPSAAPTSWVRTERGRLGEGAERKGMLSGGRGGDWESVRARAAEPDRGQPGPPRGPLGGDAGLPLTPAARQPPASCTAVSAAGPKGVGEGRMCAL